MQRFSTLTAGFAFAIAAGCTTLSAHATVYDASFSGTVQSQTGTGFSIDRPITGSFVYDSDAGRFLSFVVGGRSVASGYASTAALTPDGYEALYRAQVSPVVSGGTVNSTFTVDLEALNTSWTSANAPALLGDAGQLANNLDLDNSSFGYYTANADGTGIQSVTATLTGLQVSAVPEPATFGLMLAGLVAVGLRRRARS